MRHLLGILVVLVVLGAVVPGCGGGRERAYDGRLAAADSLLRDDPDSALAIITALPTDSLATEHDRAYRDLLLTQARYRAYVTATSDSDINRAVAYFAACRPIDREKLTRAYIYKGAVMDELGHPDSAMLYYKHAEATAAPDDYFNLGYVNLRMGGLLHEYHSLDGMEIEKFEEALFFFKQTDNIEYQHICMNNLGCALRESNPNRAEVLLKDALKISKERKDTLNIVEDLHALIVLYYYNKQYKKALNLLNEAELISRGSYTFSFCTTAANVYSRNGIIDSAMMMIGIAQNSGELENVYNRMYLLESKAEMSLLLGDSLAYLSMKEEEKRISDSLIANQSKSLIIKTEKDFDKSIYENQIKDISALKEFGLFFIPLVTIFLLVLLYKHLHNSLKYNYIINQLKRESEAQLDSLDRLQNNLNQLEIKDLRIKEFTSTQIDMIREIIIACYHEPRNKLSQKLKDILEFQENNKQQWLQIYSYLDAEYNNIMTYTRSNYPQLNDRELLLLALCCLKFSYIQIAIILGYSNPTSVGTTKLRIAEKMGINMTLNEYISTITNQS